MEKLNREEMLVALAAVFEPTEKGLSSDQIDGYLLSFCASCPDPVSAMNIVLDAPVDSTTEEILEQALALPARTVDSWSASELPINHSLRRSVFN